MNNHEQRKKLKLLPEVLPPPINSSSKSPRQRTAERMVALVALTAAACSKEDPVSIRPEDPSKMKKTQTNPDPTTTTTTTATTTAPTTTSVTPTSSPTPGYMVVDPLPPPAKCAGLASTIKATAAWKTGATGSFIELKLPKPGKPDAKYGKTPTTTPVYGGKLLSIAPAGDGLVVQVVPDSGSTNVYVYIEAACTAGTERVYASMEFKSAGGPITVTLSDVF
jgi:hypothetical protein